MVLLASAVRVDRIGLLVPLSILLLLSGCATSSSGGDHVGLFDMMSGTKQQEQPVQAAAAPEEPKPVEAPPPPPVEEPKSVEPPKEEVRVAEAEAPPPQPREEPKPVEMPPPPPPAPKLVLPDPIDLYFDFDKFVPKLSEKNRKALKELAHILEQHADRVVVIEGHCDERGTSAYNLTLGERRAKAVKEILEQMGVVPAQMHTSSYGKERPVCTEHHKSCWQKNRRAHLVMQ